MRCNESPMMPARKPAKKTPKPKPPGGSLSGRVARGIGERILKGDFAPGDLLPNEAEWGRIFVASRTAVREAVKNLNGKGLLASRPKIGSRVEPRERWNLLDRDVLAWHCAAMDRRTFLQSTQEARKLLEPGIAALAAAKRSAVQLNAINAALEGMRTAKSAEDLVAPDVAFHRALLAAANNDLLAPFAIIIEQALGTFFDYTARNNPKPDRIVPLHEAVLKAVAAGDPEAAHAAMACLLADTDRIISGGKGRNTTRS
jgi:DNA-binding FadR family transcriptional regulator